MLRAIPLLCLCGLLWAGEAAQSAPAPAGLEGPDPDVLRKAKKLVVATLSTDNTERDKAWAGLRDMGNLALPALAALARDQQTTPAMLQNVIIALGDAKDPRAAPVLLELFASPQPATRMYAARAAGEAQCQAAVPRLEKLAAQSTEDEDVRLTAGVAGAKLGSAACLDALAVLAQSPRPEVRSRAVFALGTYGGEKRIPELEAALADAEVSVREDAVEALRRTQARRAWPVLLKAARDENYRIRNAAMDALRELTREKLENDPRAWEEWWKTQAR
jgi:HEAT repeat protein